MFVAVEGVDFSGKSGFCRLLTTALDAVSYKTPPESKRQEQDEIHRIATDLEHYRYFVEVVQTASKEIAVTAAQRNVVCDRYWMSTVVCHRAMGIPATLEDMREIVMPDATVYLTVTLEVQLLRMASRAMSPGDKRMWGIRNLIRQIYEEIGATQPNFIHVETSLTTPQQALDLVMKQLSLVR